MVEGAGLRLDFWAAREPRSRSSSGGGRGRGISRSYTRQGGAKVYYVLKGVGRFSLVGTEETLGEGELIVAPAGVEHGLSNSAGDPLLVLVLVAPPPTH